MTVEEELQGGIKNALEKGVPLEKIMQTFLNAGYPQQAVQAAAKAVTEGASTIIAAPLQPVNSPSTLKVQQEQSPVKQSPAQAPIPIQAQPLPQIPPPANPEEGVGKTKIFVLVGILILLLILLGASLIFREELIGLIS